MDPATGSRESGDLYIEGGIIVDSAPEGAEVVDAQGLTVMPGLIDLHVHFREPGHETAETTSSYPVLEYRVTVPLAVCNLRLPNWSTKIIALAGRNAYLGGI